jgi:hypothetical protein
MRRVCHSEDTSSVQFLCSTVHSRHAMAQTAAILSLRRHGFNHRTLHVGFIMYKMALEQVLLLLLLLFVINVIPPTLHIRSFITVLCYYLSN